MIDKKIIEGNKLLAEFMGLEIITDDISYFDTNYRTLRKYDSDWSALMPVVEKIKTLNYAVTITQNICTIRACIMGDRTVRAHQSGNYKTPNTKIYNTWLAVIQFIKWYNQNKND